MSVIKGHLFPGCQEAFLVDDETWLKLISCYIHLNPMRAHMAKRPEGCEWSSHRAFVGNISPPAWLETNRLLSMFGKQRISVRGATPAIQPANPMLIEVIDLAVIQLRPSPWATKMW